MIKIGDLIRIEKMDGEPQYSGRIGRVTHIGKDPSGDVQVWGTWGGCALYPSRDEYTVLCVE